MRITKGQIRKIIREAIEGPADWRDPREVAAAEAVMANDQAAFAVAFEGTADPADEADFVIAAGESYFSTMKELGAATADYALGRKMAAQMQGMRIADAGPQKSSIGNSMSKPYKNPSRAARSKMQDVGGYD